MRKIFSAAIISAAALSACGGGGGDAGGGGGGLSVTPTGVNVAGLWRGTSNTNRAVSALTFADGSLWALYSPVGGGSAIAGVIQGQGSVSGNTISASDARDFSLETATITAASISATVNPKQSISGSVSTGVTFTGAYQTVFDAAPAPVVGTFTGTAAAVGGAESTTVTATATGALSGSSPSGCRFTGTLTPRTDGNAYNVSVTFGGGVCANGADTVNGVAFLDGKVIYAAALNSARNNGFLFVGTTP